MTCWRIFLCLGGKYSLHRGILCFLVSAVQRPHWPVLVRMLVAYLAQHSAVGVDRALLGSQPVLGAGYYHPREMGNAILSIY